MIGKFFNVTVKPDIVKGDISAHVGGSKGSPAAATDMGANDLVFDWTSVDVPKGTNLLRSISVWINGEDGGNDDLESYEFIFAKAVDGVAPPSLGTIGEVIDPTTAASGQLRHHYLGSFILDNTDGETITALPLAGGNLYTITSNVAAGTPNMANALPFAMDTEGDNNSGYNKLYVAGTVKAARNFGTAVLVNQSDYDASEASPAVNTVICDGTDARFVFSPGDQVYDHMSDTPIPGTLTKVEANLLTFSTTNSTVDVSNNNELINANPIRINLGFER